MSMKNQQVDDGVNKTLLLLVFSYLEDDKFGLCQPVLPPAFVGATRSDFATTKAVRGFKLKNAAAISRTPCKRIPILITTRTS